MDARRSSLLVALGLAACNPPIGETPSVAGVDSDGDSYIDGDESYEGTDPQDPESRIYTGFWPYHRDKDALANPGWQQPAVVGGAMPRLRAIDQFGELVDVYDFLHQGRPVVVELSAPWCPWCHEVARWLDGEPTVYDELTYLQEVPRMVADGEVYWITVIAEDQDGAAATADEAAAWYALHPNPRVAVLADTEQLVPGHVPVTGLPAMVLLDADGRYSRISASYTEVLAGIATLVEEDAR